MVLLPSFFFFGMVSLVALLVGSTSVFFALTVLRRLILSSMEVCSWWCTSISIFGWQMLCAEISWRVDHWCYKLDIIFTCYFFSRFSTQILLFSFEIQVSFLRLFLITANLFWKRIALLIESHSMPGWTATARYGKRKRKRSKGYRKAVKGHKERHKDFNFKFRVI